ncbi:MAG: VanZ family protein [Ruminococcus sp.]|nr:VanZ family protein [Ruminococcus sp.]
MTDNKKTVIIRIVLTVLTVAAVGFIFYNSSMSAVESTEESSPVTDMLNNLLRSLNIPLTLTENVVRKLAHFTEYTILGFLLSSTVYSYVRERKKTLLLSLALGAVIPICDELIQLFPEGRSCEVRDMLIDFSGVAFAALIVFLIISIKEKRTKKKGENSRG